MKGEDETSPVTLQDGPDAWAFGSEEMDEVSGILMTTDGLADMLTGNPDHPRITAEALRMLIPQEREASGKETTDAYYQELLFGEGAFPDGQGTEDAEAALTQIRAITDDVTVAAIWDLPGSLSSSSDADVPVSRKPVPKVRRKTASSAEEIAGQLIGGLLNRLFRKRDT